MTEEKSLFGSIGDGRDPDAQLQPRANKPSMYSLYIDGQHVEGYVSAYAALQGLRDATGNRNQKFELREDMDGAKLAEKRLVDVNNTTNLLKPVHTIPKLLLTNDMKRDLISEGRDPAAPFRDIQPIQRELQAADWFKELQSITVQTREAHTANVEQARAATPSAPESTSAPVEQQPRAEIPAAPVSVALASREPVKAPVSDWFKDLQAATAQLGQVREAGSERTAAPGAPQLTPAPVELQPRAEIPAAPVGVAQPSREPVKAPVSDWFKDLQAITAQLGQVREANAERERNGVREVVQPLSAVPDWLAALQAMQPLGKTAEQQPDSSFLNVVEAPDTKPERSYDMDLS